MGTQYGLYRFDGREFVQFNEENGLPFRQVMEIYEDEEGWFWLYRNCISKPDCIIDLAFFHSVTHQVMTFEERFGKNIGFQAKDITGFLRDSQYLHFTANKKFISWSPEGGLRQVDLKVPNKLIIPFTKINDAIYGFILTEKDTFYYLPIDTSGTIIEPPKKMEVNFPFKRIRKIPIKQSEIESFRYKNKQYSFDEHGHLTITIVPDYYSNLFKDHIPLGFLDENLFLNNKGILFHRQIGQVHNPKSLYLNPDNINFRTNILSENIPIWVKSRNKHKQQFTYENRAINPSFRHSYFDESMQTFWYAKGKGIYRVQFKERKFKHLLSKSEHNRNPFLSQAIVPINEHLFLLFASKRIFLYDSRKPNSILRKLNYKDLLHSDAIYCYSKDVQQDLIYFVSDFLGILNLKTLELQKTPINNNSTAKYLMLKDQILWVGSNDGLLWLDLSSQKLFEHKTQKSFEPIRNRSIQFFHKISPDLFWAGTNNGLFLVSYKNGVLQKFGDKEVGENYLPASSFFHMTEALEDTYWLATTSGLLKWKLPSFLKKIDSYPIGKKGLKEKPNTNKAFEHYTSANGLPTNELFAVYKDDFGFLWIPTAHGLIQFQTKTGFSKTYLKQDGVSNSGFEPYAHYKAPDGTLYLGTYEGFTVFHPEDFQEVNFNPEVPLIILDYEQRNNKTNKIENRTLELLQSNKITLQPGDKIFNIRVALSNYENAERHRFAYKIDGYQENWHEDKSNLIRIGGLPYGKFMLHIKGRLAGGQYANPILAIPITVLKPFYLQWWFIVLMFSATLGGIIYYYHRRTTRLKSRQMELEKAVAARTLIISQNNEQLKKDKAIIEGQASKLKELDKVKTRFFANVSHELRTPLTLMLGPLRTLLKDKDQKNQNLSLISTAKQHAQKLLALVGEILDLTKLDAGKLALQESPTSLFNFTQRLAATFESLAREKSIQYEFNFFANKELQVLIDQNKIEKIVNNLLSNAFKFTPKNGHIIFRVRDESENIQLSVKDSGRGIHPHDLPNVFERYYQSTRPDAPTEGGTGIGLALCSEYAKLMNGKVWVKSEVGKGSCFFFELPKKTVDGRQDDDIQLSPMAEFEEMIASPIVSDPPSTVQHPLSTVLIVEDNTSLRDYIKMILSPHYQVITAENGAEALEQLADFNRQLVVGSEQTGTSNGTSCQLIISDVMMPIMDGYQFLESLKGSDQFRHIPVIMLTALASLPDKLKALRIGVDDYMLKPFEEEELLARVKNLLAYSRNREVEKVTKKASPNSMVQNKTSISLEDIEWLEELEKVISEKVGNFNLNVEQLANLMALSRWQLNRRLKQLNGLTAIQYLQEFRLNQARVLLEQKKYSSVKAVTYAVGIKDLKYFSRQFKNRFGKLPSSYF